MRVHESLNDWISRHMGEIDAVVFDIDGVLTIEGRSMPGAPELLRFLNHEKMIYTLLTNDSLHSIYEKASSLAHCGLDIDPKVIVSSGASLKTWAHERGVRDKLFYLAGTVGDPCYAVSAGLQMTRHMDELAACRGVIVGEGSFDWEEVINGLVNFFIAKPEALFVVPNPDEYFPHNPVGIRIGPGAIARFIQRVLAVYGRRVEPEYLGKPYLPIFRRNHAELEHLIGHELDPSRVFMVGDFIESDVKGANEFGYRSALVLSGITDLQMLEQSIIKPQLVFNRL